MTARDYEFPGDVSRRAFLERMGAGLAFASGMGGCMKMPREAIEPYAIAPENWIPGAARYYATAMPFRGFATGLLVESHDGRPTKVEGNPEHPASLGATGVFEQASVLEVYDPDRSRAVLARGAISSWDAFLSALDRERETWLLEQGAGLRVLTGTVTSPTLGAQLARFQARFPRARWHQYEPLTRDAVREGARLAFGRVLEPQYQLEHARTIVSLDADFLQDSPGRLRLARDFARGRRIYDASSSMSRLYAIESGRSVTGAMADHRIAARPSELPALVHELARALFAPSTETGWAVELATDLRRGGGVLIAGEGLSPELHALTHSMNQQLGSTAVHYTDPVEVRPESQLESFRRLISELERGEVRGLLILGENPAYASPAELGFARLLDKVPFTVHLGLFVDETAARTRWHVPQAHFLETWSDARAFDGTSSILQPLISPLYGGRSSHELLERVIEPSSRSSHELVRSHWLPALGESGWKSALRSGVIPGTRLEPRAVRVKNPPRIPAAPTARVQQAGAALEARFAPDAGAWDGRYSNNEWLAEFPRPLTRLCWDAAALASPATAKRLGAKDGDVLAIASLGTSVESSPVEAALHIVPGHADDTLTLPLGFGRTHAGRIGDGAGFDAYRLLAADGSLSAPVSVRRTDRRMELAFAQVESSLEGRDIYRDTALETFRKTPDGTRHEPWLQPTLYPDMPQSFYAWGMSIDLGSCIGCGACVVACVAENNIPTVGREMVRRGRAMQWIRVDRYFQTDERVGFQPVPCMHCEKAPCEVVCPVGATVHSDEGLNEMVYNRCVGTRYCSNNCPYKVRRFNFLEWNDWGHSRLEGVRNPDVSVRSRGVMEKCTYCVQRINEARIDAEEENRLIRDGEIRTACEQACPTEAIVFGDLLDKQSRVNRERARPQSYFMLASLGTRPRTGYLARILNPNPSIPTESRWS
jgi:molybdopterin-containing oxidoreductase family iron-sulfur binding subunit